MLKSSELIKLLKILPKKAEVSFKSDGLKLELKEGGKPSEVWKISCSDGHWQVFSF